MASPVGSAAPPWGERGERGAHGAHGAHGAALEAVARARLAILSDAADANFAVGSRAFRPYVYVRPEGAGTPLESALRFADSRVVVERPALSDDLADPALGAFCGFRAGQGGLSGGPAGLGSAAPAGFRTAEAAAGAPAGAACAECAPSALPSSAGLFCASTRPAMSGAS
jgi:hypothetical protein